MPRLHEQTIAVNGTPTRALRSGDGPSVLMFLHGGTPGLSPYCSGAHIWGGVLERFAAERSVVAIDLPGSGGTPLTSGEFSLDAQIEHVRGFIRAAGISQCHLVGHDLGGLLALALAPMLPEVVRAVSVVASVVAAPTGDGIENLSLRYPPVPTWSRQSQAWALDRISFSPHHVTDELLDACVSAAAGAPHRGADEVVRQGGNEDRFVPSVMRAKLRFYETCRGAGLPVPTQVIWGSHDPLGSFEQGLWLYRLVAARQRATHLHVINRVGALPFREDPDVFHQVVAGFYDVVFAS